MYPLLFIMLAATGDFANLADRSAFYILHTILRWQFCRYRAQHSAANIDSALIFRYRYILIMYNVADLLVGSVFGSF